MEIEVWSVGKAKFTADPEFQEPMIREAIDTRGDVASTVLDYTDSERSDIVYDEYARVTGDVPGLVLLEGWLTGDRDAPPPPGVTVPADVLAGRHAVWNTDLGQVAAHPLGPWIIRFMHATQEHDAAVRKVGLHYQLEVDRLHDVYRAAHDLAGAVAAAREPEPVPDRTAATESALRMAIAFIEQVRDGAYGDLATADAERALYEIRMP